MSSFLFVASFNPYCSHNIFIASFSIEWVKESHLFSYFECLFSLSEHILHCLVFQLKHLCVWFVWFREEVSFSCIYHALDLIDVCLFRIVKVFIKVLYVKDSFCILWKEEHHSSLLKRKYCISSVIEKLKLNHHKHWKLNETSYVVIRRLSAFRRFISEIFHSLIVALILCYLSLN